MELSSGARRLLKSHTLVEIATGENSSSKLTLPHGKILQRLLACLANDFYRPKSVTAIHEVIFSESFFLGKPSVDKVHQALKRLRHFFLAAHIPLEIYEYKASYMLRARQHHGIGLIVSNGLGQKLKSEELRNIGVLRTLFRSFGNVEFTSNDFARAEKISKRTAQRQLPRAVDCKWIVSIGGSGPATRYRLIDPSRGKFRFFLK